MREDRDRDPGSGRLVDDVGSALRRASELLRAARGVVVLTGAGLSADSGLSTFRGNDGLWQRYRPEELATPEAFARDPRLVWEWYGMRRAAAAASAPNRAHLALARLAVGRDDVAIVTQNVDGLHTLAARQVVTDEAAIRRASPFELHGCLFRVRCTLCNERREHRDPVDAASPTTLPRCPSCAGLLRPDVVWFGEPLGQPIEEAFRLASEAGVCLVIGTSAAVHPAAGVALITHENGGRLVEINPEPTPLTPLADVSVRGRAVEVVPELVASVCPG